MDLSFVRKMKGLDEGQVRSLEETELRAISLVAATVENVRLELSSDGTPASVETLYARIIDAQRAEKIANVFRDLREAVREYGKS